MITQSQTKQITDVVNQQLSQFYNQPVIAGYTYGGYMVVRPANDPQGVIAGGMEGLFMPVVVKNVIKHAGKLVEALDQLIVE